MREALKQARYAYEEGEIPAGAVVVCNNQIIARAYNQVERLCDVTAHAEILAITAAENYLSSKYLKECRMYVTLEPCAMCAGALFWSQIDGLIYGASDPERGFMNTNNKMLHPRTEVVEGVLREECQHLIKDFFKQLRHKNSNIK